MMKRWIPTVSAVAFASLAALVLYGRSVTPTACAQARPAAPPKAVLAVSALAKNPGHYQGALRVEGVVSKVSPKEKTLALIDTAEYEKCGEVDCAPFYLPVRWGGQMPAVTNQVRVEGEIQKQNGKLVFVARSLEKVAPKAKKP